MQIIEAVVKPNKVDAVKAALSKMGIFGCTALECKGYGRQLGVSDRHRSSKQDQGFVPKVLLKICVNTEHVDDAAAAIIEAARTGEVGDGKIFIYPIAQVIRIRTGEKGTDAI